MGPKHGGHDCDQFEPGRRWSWSLRAPENPPDFHRLQRPFPDVSPGPPGCDCQTTSDSAFSPWPRLTAWRSLRGFSLTSRAPTRVGNRRFQRAVLPETFPFVVFFRELSDCIRNLAVAHGACKPGYWARQVTTLPSKFWNR